MHIYIYTYMAEPVSSSSEQNIAVCCFVGNCFCFTEHFKQTNKNRNPKSLQISQLCMSTLNLV